MILNPQRTQFKSYFKYLKYMFLKQYSVQNTPYVGELGVILKKIFAPYK